MKIPQKISLFGHSFSCSVSSLFVTHTLVMCPDNSIKILLITPSRSSKNIWNSLSVVLIAYLFYLTFFLVETAFCCVSSWPVFFSLY